MCGVQDCAAAAGDLCPGRSRGRRGRAGDPLNLLAHFTAKNARDNEDSFPVVPVDPGRVIVHDLVIRSQAWIDLFFPEHAAGYCPHRQMQYIRGFVSFRSGIVELEFRKFPVFFPEPVSPDFCKAPADRESDILRKLRSYLPVKTCAKKN